ncbi:MAG: DUF6088 family protein, partial [Pseudomonas sp.]
RSQHLSEGAMLAPKEFLHLGSRAAVDQAFSRLAKAGKLLRVSRGLYAAPITGRFGKRAPATQKVVSALAAKTYDTLTLSGAQAANALGLTRQVPVKEIFFTSGRSRTLQLGKAKIQIKNAPRWMLALGATPAGDAVRALAWMGEEHAHDAVKTLHERLPSSEWETLNATRAQLPSWMARAIGEEASGM